MTTTNINDCSTYENFSHFHLNRYTFMSWIQLRDIFNITLRNVQYNNNSKKTTMPYNDVIFYQRMESSWIKT